MIGGAEHTSKVQTGNLYRTHDGCIGKVTETKIEKIQ